MPVWGTKLPRNTFAHSAADLDRFRQVQRLAYDIALRVEAQLRIGMTEAEVASLLAATQIQQGIFQFYHEPFAWFGSRTMLEQLDPGETETGAAPLRTHPKFFPTGETLADGTPVILDLAPAVNGISADVGYSCVVGKNKLFNELDAGLARIRTMLVEGIRGGDTLRSLSRLLDQLLAERGWENCHRHYPTQGLGHLVFPLEPDPDRASPVPGMGTAAAEGLLAAGAEALEYDSCYPVWNDSTFADHPAAPGIWAIEPHIGRDRVGVKFEELLVVTEDDAFWLDDHLPHLFRWAAARYSTESFRRG
jgi:Xaa-Pro aminopeptidase